MQETPSQETLGFPEEATNLELADDTEEALLYDEVPQLEPQRMLDPTSPAGIRQMLDNERKRAMNASYLEKDNLSKLYAALGATGTYHETILRQHIRQASQAGISTLSMTCTEWHIGRQPPEADRKFLYDFTRLWGEEVQARLTLDGVACALATSEEILTVEGPLSPSVAVHNTFKLDWVIDY